MYNTRDWLWLRWFHKRLGIRISMSAHGTRHCLVRCGPALFPLGKTRCVKVMPTCRLGRRLLAHIVVANCTFGRNLRWRWKKFCTFRMSPAHRQVFVLGALAWRTTLDSLCAPRSWYRKSPRYTRSARSMNKACRISRGTLIFTGCTRPCDSRAGSTRRRRWRARWAKIRVVRSKPMDTEKMSHVGRYEQVGTVSLKDDVCEPFNQRHFCLFVNGLLFLFT